MRVRTPELDQVAGRLLEVVGDDLVPLDERLPVLVEPVRETRVEIGTHRLWQGVVRSVADEQMPEAVAVLARELSTVGPDQLAAHQPCESRRHLCLLRA